MTERKSAYKRIGEKAARGEFDLVVPLDYMLLEQLVEEGTTFGGLYEIGSSVKDLVKFFDHKVSNAQLSGRLTSLRAQGLAAPVRVMGKRELTAWQRTERGNQLVEEWKKSNGSR